MSDKITLYINDRFRNRKVDFFNNFRFSLAYDSLSSSFGFAYYFDPFNIEHKEASCVTHFHEVEIRHNDIPFLKGVIVNQDFSQSSVKELSSFGGYSLPGILEDCQIPPSIYPLQSNGLSLTAIARKLIKPWEKNYGLKMIIDPSVQAKMDKVYNTTTADATQTVKDYLVQLTKDRDIIMSHDTQGRLLFTSANTKGTPIMELDMTKPTPKGVSIRMSYDGRSMHSHITVMKQQSIDGGNSGQHTIRNPYVIGSVYRPAVKNQSSGDDIDTRLAARRELGNELRNITLTITYESWLINDGFILPNNTITIYAPELYLYHKKDWFIESVDYVGDSNNQSCVINCVLPEVYNDDEVISVFRDINLHAIGNENS